jgi:hypothetical protein
VPQRQKPFAGVLRGTPFSANSRKIDEVISATLNPPSNYFFEPAQGSAEMPGNYTVTTASPSNIYNAAQIGH